MPEASPASPEGTCVDRTGRRWPDTRVTNAPPSIPTITSSPSPDKIAGADRVLAAARGKVRGCYQSALSRDERVSGRVTYTTRLATDGAVAHVCLRATGTIAQSVAMPCFEELLLGLRFSPPEPPTSPGAEPGRSTVAGSFSFQNANAEPAPAPLPAEAATPTN